MFFGKPHHMFQALFPLPQLSTWDLAYSAQKRCHRQSLTENRKRHHGEADRNDLLAVRDLGRESKSQGKRHSPSQAAPKKDVLMFHRDRSEERENRKRQE